VLNPDLPHCLYRMFDDTGQLLYVGITGTLSQRFTNHHEKPWWPNVADVTVEMHPNRDAVLAAEKTAIQTEKPLHNVMHNRGGGTTRKAQAGEPEYTIRGLVDPANNVVTAPARLTYELPGDSISDHYSSTEVGAFTVYKEWRDYLRGGAAPGYLPITWYVDGAAIFESADPTRVGSGDHYLDHYSLPADPATGRPVALIDLPVHDKRWTPEWSDKGGFIAEATGWKPRPLQTYVDLKPLHEMAYGIRSAGR
jgi:hypothetical protein